MPYQLITRTQEKWNTPSSELNRMNTDFLFETDNEFGFPIVRTSKDFHAEDLIPFHTCKKCLAKDRDKAVHFFLDDYKFEQVWSRPRDFVTTFKHYGNILVPTFSVWENQPYALNLFNIYRSRWIARFYQEYGINVLIDVRWADESTYPFCFSGIEKNSPVIVNTVGTHYRDNRDLFKRGFEVMINSIEPSKLYVYGEYYPVEFEKYFDSVTYFDSEWAKKRRALKEKTL